MLVHIFCGHAGLRLCQQDMAVGQGGQGSDFFPDTLCQGGSAHKAEGDVRSQLQAQLHQPGQGDIQVKKAADPLYNGGGVCASPCQPCRHGDLLLQVDVYPQRDMVLFPHQHGGPEGQIVLSQGDLFGIAGEGDAFPGFLQSHQVAQIYGLHDHFYQVVSVLPLSCHIQAQIDLSMRFYLINFHSLNPDF